MKYWEDFQTKWGFSEGEATPQDAWAHRFVYVREINRKAAALGSKVRLVAYDRPGMHNSYLILRVPAGLADRHSEMDLCNGTAGDRFDSVALDTKDDAQMDAAIDYFVSVEDEDIDEYIRVDVTIYEKDDDGEIVESRTL